LAQLDSAIHFTPKSLDIASATRARIIKRLAEDLHTPLMDSLIRLDRFKAMTMGEPSEKCSKYLQLSKTSVQKVLSLLNDLLTMEQLNSGKIDLSIENCSGFDIVDDAINMASGLAVAKNILIVNESVDCKITADGERLVQGWNG
jgi:signal transduction histidine kinase